MTAAASTGVRVIVGVTEVLGDVEVECSGAGGAG